MRKADVDEDTASLPTFDEVCPLPRRPAAPRALVRSAALPVPLCSASRPSVQRSSPLCAACLTRCLSRPSWFPTLRPRPK